MASGRAATIAAIAASGMWGQWAAENKMMRFSWMTGRKEKPPETGLVQGLCCAAMCSRSLASLAVVTA